METDGRGGIAEREKGDDQEQRGRKRKRCRR